LVALQQAVTLAHALWPALLFALAILLLDMFDIALPRGDMLGVGSALCAAALMILGPLQGAIVSLCVVPIAAALRPGSVSRAGMTVLASGRAAGLLTGTLVWIGVSSAPQPAVRYAGAAVCAAAFLLADLFVSQFSMAVSTGRPLGRLVRGSLNMQAPLLAAQLSAAVLAVITWGEMGAWSLVPVTALLLLIRQSYAMLLDVRETYRTTVEVLVEAAEAQDARRAGHSERAAAIARAIGMKVGLPANEVERISYAALLHDVDALAGEAASHDSAGTPQSPGRSSAVVEEATFFEDVVSVVRICDGDGVEARQADESDLTAALIVALASDADAAEYPDVLRAHCGSAVDRVAGFVPSSTKALVVGAALSLGYQTPAVR
jgi:hypothetical protein